MPRHAPGPIWLSITLSHNCRFRPPCRCVNSLVCPHTAAPLQLVGSLTLQGRPPPVPRPLPSSVVRAHRSAGPEHAQSRTRPSLVLRAPPLSTGAALDGPDAPTGAPWLSQGYGLFSDPPRGPLRQDKNWARTERVYSSSAILAGQATHPQPLNPLSQDIQLSCPGKDWLLRASACVDLTVWAC
ncbi:hypothetical protein NDU88_005263 [Pleurodeles waltl]|uniref:Uncharacterized protein n=1 Tax=Pleurodeles waltl TaxID=8319 RepID=A0AAV7LC05_PLEWA|nr:hypothetical protein NDU88_005263 [Pleurodeles waltl]